MDITGSPQNRGRGYGLAQSFDEECDNKQSPSTKPCWLGKYLHFILGPILLLQQFTSMGKTEIAQDHVGFHT